MGVMKGIACGIWRQHQGNPERRDVRGKIRGQWYRRRNSHLQLILGAARACKQIKSKGFQERHCDDTPFDIEKTFSTPEEKSLKNRRTPGEESAFREKRGLRDGGKVAFRQEKSGGPRKEGGFQRKTFTSSRKGIKKGKRGLKRSPGSGTQAAQREKPGVRG